MILLDMTRIYFKSHCLMRICLLSATSNIYCVW